MASISDANLSITHDHRKKTAKAVVNCKVHFTEFEMCQMKSCANGHVYKLKCQLWGADSGLTGADDFLYTYSNVHYFPDVSPAGVENRTFDVTLGEGVLDEDWGTDEIYGKLKLVNLYTQVQTTKKTNEVAHSF